MAVKDQVVTPEYAIYCADCIDVMQDMPDGKAEIVLRNENDIRMFVDAVRDWLQSNGNVTPWAKELPSGQSA